MEESEREREHANEGELGDRRSFYHKLQIAMQNQLPRQS